MDLSSIQIPATFALAVIAAIGYLVGRRAGKNRDELAARSERELRQSRSVAREMDKISRSLRRAVARHHGDLKRVGQLLQEHAEAAARDAEYEDADEPLDFTLPSSVQVAGACVFHEEDSRFMTVATTPLTGPTRSRVRSPS